jgi:hypothetical protein
VEISIHEVSPGFIVNIHQNFAIRFTPLGIMIDNLSQGEFLIALIKCWHGYKNANSERHEKDATCPKGILKFQKELELEAEIFPNLHMWPIDDDTTHMSIQAESKLGMIVATKVQRNVHGESLCLIRSDQSNPTFGERHIS